MCCIVGSIFCGCKKNQTGPESQAAQGKPLPVQVLKPIIQDVENTLEFTGNTAAVEHVDLRARVEGILQTAGFSEGADVKAGDLLFTIEPDLYQVRCDHAQAQLQADRAELQRAQLDFERAEIAIKTNAISQQELTTKQAQRDQAQARVLAAQASLKTAQLDLSYTQVASPIAGRISKRFVDPGNLVGAGEKTLLASVVTLQPIYVNFHVSEEILQQYFLQNRPHADQRLPFSIALAGDKDFPHQGHLDYIDNQVDPLTGTIAVRGQLPNSDNHLLPGMFVRIRIPINILPKTILVEQRALQSDISGKFLLLVGPGNIVQPQPVQIGKTVGNLVVIASGLKGDETYIVSGFHFARPGAPVTPIPDDAPASAPGLAAEAPDSAQPAGDAPPSSPQTKSDAAPDHPAAN